MKSAPPVALFLYKRPEQSRRTLECLRGCGISELYVFCDGPREPGDVAAVGAVRELVEAIEWIEPTVVARGHNLGLSDSIRSGLDAIFQTRDTVVVIEDDVAVAPEFYAYAGAALHHYADHERVAGVTGLRYPFDRGVFADYPYDVFLSPRFSSWAWATWRDRWRSFDFDVTSLRARIARARSFRPDRAGADMAAMLHGAIVTRTLGGSWDVLCAANMLLDTRFFVTPVWNMVENTGLSEGTHFDAPPQWQLHWESSRAPAIEALRFAPVEPDERVLRAYRRFFASQDGARGALARARLATARWRTTRALRRG